MRIAQLTPGSGDNFYCENCLRDTGLVRALRRAGHDVVLVPMYLPIGELSHPQDGAGPLFFGGINAYLQQKLGLFRRTPRRLDRLLDARWLLRLFGAKAGATSPRLLGDMTVSMLKGRNGRQAKELQRLLDWLGLPENRPDVVVLSNLLLAGLAGPIRAELGTPVVCMLQDEEGFLDGLPEPYRNEAWGILASRAADIDVFVAVSRYYAEKMRHRLALEPSRVEVVYAGIDLEAYGPAGKATEPSTSPPVAATTAAVPTIGFLSQMCEAKGLDTLVSAFVILKKDERLAGARLRIAGGLSGADKAFVARLDRELETWGLGKDVEYVERFDVPARVEFLRGLTVLTVPERQAAAYGMYVLEAMAGGVPVVEPAEGVFVELMELTGGGVLYEPNDAAHLAEALKGLLVDPDRARRLGELGRRAVTENFDIRRTVADLERVYEKVVHR